MIHTTIEHCSAGTDATTAQPGDFVLLHRPGFVPSMIGLGERLRFGKGHWSHVAYVITPIEIIEALARGVERNPLSEYRDIGYVVVHTHMNPLDVEEANAFALSCVGQRYGFFTDFGIALRFLTPGRGLWFGMDGTEICSGLVAQALVRGTANFKVNPASISPTELAAEYGAAR